MSKQEINQSNVFSKRNKPVQMCEMFNLGFHKYIWQPIGAMEQKISTSFYLYSHILYYKSLLTFIEENILKKIIIQYML